MARRRPRDPPRPVAETVTVDAGRSPFEGGVAFSVIRAFHSRLEIRATTAQPQSHHGEGIFSRHQDDQIRGPGLEEPARLQALQPGRDGRRQVDEGPPAVLGGLLAHVRGIRWRPVRRRDAPFGRGRTAPTRVEIAEQTRATSCFEFMQKLGVAVLLLPRPRRGPGRARPSQREPRNLDEVAKILKEQQKRDRHQAALGHGQPLRATRVTCTGRRRVRNADVFAYAAAQVKKAMEVTQRTRRRRLRLLGRPRGLPHPLSTPT